MILLCLMPFWSPLAPPLGISLLKRYLMDRDYEAATHDFNALDELWQIRDRYFEILAEIVPREKQSNFNMVGFDVLSNHLMAYFHKDESPGTEYRELLDLLIRKNYYVESDTAKLDLLDQQVQRFYQVLADELNRVLDGYGPFLEVFGVSVYSTSLAPSLFAFKLVKQRFPHIKTVMGGGVFADHLAPDSPNFPLFLERTKAYLDTVIAGEGEIILERFLAGELEQEKRVYTIDDIGRQTMSISEAKTPDFSGLELASYSQMMTYASRSCPFQCGFCSETVQWGHFRKKTGEQVADEIRDIRQQYGGKLFMFGDSLVNPIIGDLSQCLVEREMDIFWDAYLRTDKAVGDAACVELWRKGGFYRARLGVETGSQHVLDLMNKKMTVQHVKNAISTLARFGIKTTTYWVIGYPGEREEDFQSTLDLMEELKDDIYEADWHPFYFFPQGQVNSHRWVKEYGIQLLYPDKYTPLLLTQTWVLGGQGDIAGREEIYQRMNRFAQTCQRLGIPNPYSMMDIHQADKRWKELHPQCGPALLELHNHNFLKP